MIEIPDDVEQWTYGKIVDLVNEGYDENDILEIKQDVNEDSDRFARSVCAFANTNGGTIIFGIDNNRKKPLHLNDRICGLDDSDQLKRNIIDKIKHIQPSIPIKNLIFRKTNIKLPNKRVIVILKVTPSSRKPHEWNHVFLKRLSDGNEPMDVTEVKQTILESQKNERLLTLLRQEAGLLRYLFEKSKKLLEEDKIRLTTMFLNTIPVDTVKYFMLNQSFLYPVQSTQSLMRILEVVEKMESISKKHSTTNILNGDLKKSLENHIALGLQILIPQGLKHLSELENHLDVKLIPTIETEEYDPLFDKLENPNDNLNDQTSNKS
ncbi:hypothetical protein NZNM25_14350 [Nitrosopumilus zosterae]|uniref:Schlafen AlbA-2 domain-containing protein n=1 Tax=Nitrosopumilus zosterae TaxID=718286 RepID=A0A2S2KSP1_9ARCH|nr:ATP-binding protein [Nitrosopumilus zosterae]BDQ30741.1 ATP-binding protein [Nitrosopumilus zosterae]GBH34644.1 hypothetical protein NZNM25_14350 [Nitrosopumilus zosterae]